MKTVTASNALLDVPSVTFPSIIAVAWAWREVAQKDIPTANPAADSTRPTHATRCILDLRLACSGWANLCQTAIGLTPNLWF